MAAKRVLSVGQCGADHFGISRTLKTSFDVEVVSADSAAEALATLREGPFALVLVNRVLDADGSSGLVFIQALKADAALKAAPVMLVSNYEEAQAEAVAMGATPGFGKAALGKPRTLERLRPYLVE